MFKSEFHKQFLSLFGYDYAKGAKELGVSERQVRRYVKSGKASLPVEKLTAIIYRVCKRCHKLKTEEESRRARGRGQNFQA